MKNLLLLLLSLITMAGLPTLLVAQQPATVTSKAKQTPPLKLTGKVVAVNANAKSVTVLINGKENIVYAPHATALPKIGEKLEFARERTFVIVYDNCEKCKADCSESTPGVCFLTPNGCVCYKSACPPCWMR